MKHRRADLIQRIRALDPEPGREQRLDDSARELADRIAAVARGRPGPARRSRGRIGGALALAALAACGTALAASGWVPPGFSVFEDGRQADVGDLRHPLAIEQLSNPDVLKGEAPGDCRVAEGSLRLARQTPSGIRVFVATTPAGGVVFITESPNAGTGIGCGPIQSKANAGQDTLPLLEEGYQAADGTGHVIGLVPDGSWATLRDGTPVSVENNVFIVEDWTTVIVHLPDGTKQVTGSRGPVFEARADSVAGRAVEEFQRRAGVEPRAQGGG